MDSGNFQRRTQKSSSAKTDKQSHSFVCGTVVRKLPYNSSLVVPAASSSVETAAAVLYQLVVEPLEPYLPQVVTDTSGPASLLLVLPAELLALPWGLLRPLNGQRKLLADRFHLQLADSLAALQHARCCGQQQQHVEEHELLSKTNCGPGSLVLGAPSQTPSNRSDQEACRATAELLGVRPLLGAEATSAALLAALPGKEVLHLSTPLLGGALGLAPAAHIENGCNGEQPSRTHSLSRVCGAFEVLELHDEVQPDTAAASGHNSSNSQSLRNQSLDPPASSRCSISAATLLHSDLRAARLVVLSCSVGSGALEQLQVAQALLAAGAQSVLFRLWPCPEPASAAKMFLRSLYSGLLREQSVARALGLALRTIRDSPGLQSPRCWAGWLLLGRGTVKLRSRSRQLAAALRTLLVAPSASGRAAARVCLHLVEKSLARMGAGLRTPMFTSLSAVRTRCAAPAPNNDSDTSDLEAGWSALLAACGFRLERGQDAVFFPGADPADRLSQCSAALQALLGLQAGVASALGALLTGPPYLEETAGRQLVLLLRDATSDYEDDEEGLSRQQLLVSLALWRLPGCP